MKGVNAPMKILVVTAHDAVNLSIENVIRELVKRGHEIYIFARMTEHRHIRMFENLHLLIRPVSELSKNEVAKYDFAFCPIDAVSSLTFYNIYIFTYNFIYSTRWSSDGGDFMFMQAEERPIIQWEDCARMAVGSPKNDTPIHNITSNSTILFVDTGHYPFGLEGKRELAETVLTICKSCTNSKIIVKPRRLPKEKNITHPEKTHLYCILSEITNEQLPTNLELLYEHRDMQELIDGSTLVITPGSTAYLDAVLRGKNILILNGFTSENSFDLRTDTILKQQFDVMRESGCLIDFREIEHYLPDGLHCREEHLNKVAASPGNVSVRVVDAIEYVYSKFLAKGQFPEIIQYDLGTYRDLMRADDSVNYTILKQKRIKNQTLLLSRGFDCAVADIDYQPWLDMLNKNYRDYPATPEGKRAFWRQMERKLYEVWVNEKEKMFFDPIDQALFLHALNGLGRTNEILALQNSEIICEGPYHYHLALIYRDQKQTTTAIEYFVKFLKDANSRPYEKYPQDHSGIRNAYNYIFKNYNGENISASEFADLYIVLYEQRDAMIVTYSNRKQAHNRLPKVANQLADTDSNRALKCLQLYAKWEYHYNIRPLDNHLKSIQNAKLYRFRNNINLFVRKLKGGMRCLREHGLSYTLNRGLKKIRQFLKKKIKDKSFYRIWNTFRTKVLVGYHLYAQTIENNGEATTLFLSGPGTGDTYVFASLFKEFISRNFSNQNVVLIVIGKSSVDVANLFGINLVKAVSVDDFRALTNLLMFGGTHIMKVHSLHYHWFYRHTAILGYPMGIHGFNFLSFPAAYLGVSEDKISKPVFFANKKELQELFLQNGLIPHKTVVLTPHVKTFKAIPNSFWICLAGTLLDKGLSVCTNAVNTEPPILGTVPIFVPYQASVPFLEMAGATIGVRSGFQDVTSTAECIKISLVCKDQPTGYLCCNGGEAFYLNEMYHYSNQYDLLYSPEIEEHLIEEIVQSILAYLDDRGKVVD